MSRIFLSHSSANNAEAVALYDWLEREGWKDEIFLDLDPERGIAAGERWERRLHEAANRCADSDEGGQLFRLKADSVSDRLRTPFR